MSASREVGGRHVWRAPEAGVTIFLSTYVPSALTLGVVSGLLPAEWTASTSWAQICAALVCLALLCAGMAYRVRIILEGESVTIINPLTRPMRVSKSDHAQASWSDSMFYGMSRFRGARLVLTSADSRVAASATLAVPFDGKRMLILRGHLEDMDIPVPRHGAFTEG